MWLYAARESEVGDGRELASIIFRLQVPQPSDNRFGPLERNSCKCFINLRADVGNEPTALGWKIPRRVEAEYMDCGASTFGPRLENARLGIEGHVFRRILQYRMHELWPFLIQLSGRPRMIALDRETIALSPGTIFRHLVAGDAGEQQVFPVICQPIVARVLLSSLAFAAGDSAPVLVQDTGLRTIVLDVAAMGVDVTFAIGASPAKWSVGIPEQLPLGPVEPLDPIHSATLDRCDALLSLIVAFAPPTLPFLALGLVERHAPHFASSRSCRMIS